MFLEYGADTEAVCRPGLRFGGGMGQEVLTACDVIAGTFSKVDILKGVDLNRLLLQKSREREVKWKVGWGEWVYGRVGWFR